MSSLKPIYGVRTDWTLIFPQAEGVFKYYNITQAGKYDAWWCGDEEGKRKIVDEGMGGGYKISNDVTFERGPITFQTLSIVTDNQNNRRARNKFKNHLRGLVCHWECLQNSCGIVKTFF